MWLFNYNRLIGQMLIKLTMDLSFAHIGFKNLEIS